MRPPGLRAAAKTLLVFALTVTACSPTAQSGTTVAPIAPTAPPPTTTLPPDTQGPEIAQGAEIDLPEGAVVLPSAIVTSALAPTIPIDGPEPLVGIPRMSREDEVVAPPEGAEFTLDACTYVGPGTYLYDFTAGGDVSYPFRVTLSLLRTRGDVGTGSQATYEIPESGAHRVIEAHGDSAILRWDAYLESQEPSTSPVGRAQPPSFSGCGLETDTLGALSSSIEMSTGTTPIRLTAPDSTVERLAQAAFARGEEAVLAPLAKVYGDAIAFYTTDWFIPRDPGRLISVAENLTRNGCLQLTFHYDSYSVVQRSGCRAVATDAVFRSGRRWTAVAGNPNSTVTVFAATRGQAIGVAESLEPYYLMRHRPLPLAPHGEEQLAHAEIEGRELLVTQGWRRCDDECGDTGMRIFVYEVTQSGLVDFANYPYYGCLIAEEVSFVLAIAQKRYRLRVDFGDGLKGVPAAESGYRTVLTSPADPTAVRVVDRSTGDEPSCVQQTRDGGGGVENLAGGPDEALATPAPALRTIDQFECDRLPAELGTYTDVALLATACANSSRGTVTMAIFVPNREVVEPPHGRQPIGWLCLVTMIKDGSSFNCTDDLEEFRRPEITDVWASAQVPIGTDEVIATLSSGQTISAVPLNGLAHLPWPRGLGELLEVVARTGDEFDVIYSRSAEVAEYT